LEYKNLKHILSIGTFRRTFFLAAPSDPLMLQWAYVMEMVKNAQDGTFVHVSAVDLTTNMVQPLRDRERELVLTGPWQRCRTQATYLAEASTHNTVLSSDYPCMQTTW